MMNKFQYLLIVLIFLISGCSETSDKKIASELYNLKQKNLDMESRIARLEEKQNELSNKIVKLEVINKYNETGSFNAINPKGYSKTLISDGHIVSISLEDLQPHLNGYKLLLNLGNLSSAIYQGFDLKAKWGPKFDQSKINYLEWEKAQKETKQVYSDILYPGTRKRVELIIEPAKTEEIEDIEISIHINSVGLTDVK